jgi:hypothetical protein
MWDNDLLPITVSLCLLISLPCPALPSPPSSDQIHVMRDSLQKLRDSYMIVPFDSSFSGGTSTGDTIAGDATEQAVSKWLGHVSSVLKGAASVAESILLGHPVLVHCRSPLSFSPLPLTRL